MNNEHAISQPCLGAKVPADTTYTAEEATGPDVAPLAGYRIGTDSSATKTFF